MDKYTFTSLNTFWDKNINNNSKLILEFGFSNRKI